ncbi:MAG: outer membrane lipoprotein carrier protein LolA [Bdellovibrionota bacterium]|mgnify:CR=1 FL=1
MKFVVFVFSIFIALFAEAHTLRKTLEKYSKATSLKFDIKKVDEKVALGTKSESHGILKYQKNKMYILQNGDKKVEIFYLNKALTLVEYPDADFDETEKRKVTVIKNASSPLITSLLNLFSNPKEFNKQFSTISENVHNDVFTAELKPKLNNIKNLSLKINKKTLELIELSFIDDVDTKTTLHFENSKHNAKMLRSEFQYKQLKTDEVMIQ